MSNTQTWQEYDQQKKSERLTSLLIFLSATLTALTISLVCLCFEANASITDKQATECILGEARGEGYDSMLAHAEAIRNRGHLKGVYGCKADLSKEMSYLLSTGIYEKAQKAWRESAKTNTVSGASFWGSLKVDGKWIAEMERKGFIRTRVIKNTAFYRGTK